MSTAGLALRPGQVPLKLSQVRNLRKAQSTHWHVFGDFCDMGVFSGVKYSEKSQRSECMAG